MDKKLKSMINKIKSLPRIRLNSATPESFEAAKKILGKNMPKQLEQWLELYDGAVFNVGDEFFPVKNGKGIECMYELSYVNSKEYKQECDIDDCARCFGKPSFAGFYCYDGDEENQETIYLWDCEESAAITEWADFSDFLKDIIDNLYLVEDAFEIYYEKFIPLFEKTHGTLPITPFNDKISKRLLQSDRDESGNVTWLPQRLEETDISDVEEKLGFYLNGNIRDYFTKLLFCSLEGKISNKTLRFFPVESEAVEDTILKQFEAAQVRFPDSEMFLLGRASVKDNDGYLIFYDNSVDKLFLLEEVTGKKLNLGSLSLTIATMKPIC